VLFFLFFFYDTAASLFSLRRRKVLGSITHSPPLFPRGTVVSLAISSQLLVPFTHFPLPRPRQVRLFSYHEYASSLCAATFYIPHRSFFTFRERSLLYFGRTSSSVVFVASFLRDVERIRISFFPPLFDFADSFKRENPPCREDVSRPFLFAWSKFALLHLDEFLPFSHVRWRSSRHESEFSRTARPLWIVEGVTLFFSCRPSPSV